MGFSLNIQLMILSISLKPPGTITFEQSCHDNTLAHKQ